MYKHRSFRTDEQYSPPPPSRKHPYVIKILQHLSSCWKIATQNLNSDHYTLPWNCHPKITVAALLPLLIKILGSLWWLGYMHASTLNRGWVDCVRLRVGWTTPFLQAVWLWANGRQGGDTIVSLLSSLDTIWRNSIEIGWNVFLEFIPSWIAVATNRSLQTSPWETITEYFLRKIIPRILVGCVQSGTWNFGLRFLYCSFRRPPCDHDTCLLVIREPFQGNILITENNITSWLYISFRDLQHLQEIAIVNLGCNPRRRNTDHGCLLVFSPLPEFNKKRL